MGKENCDKWLQQNEFSPDEAEYAPRRLARFAPQAIDLTTRLTERLTLRAPLMSSPMDTVTGAEMAILMAQFGGIGVIHFNQTIQGQMAEVDRVRRYEAGFVKNPVVLGRNATVGEVKAAEDFYGFSSFPITRDGTANTPMIGIVTHRDVRYVEDLDRPVVSVMTKKRKIKTARKEETLDRNDIRAANKVLRDNNLDTLPIVDEAFRVVALVTASDLEKNEKYPHATKDSNHQLKVLVAVESNLLAAKDRIIAARDSGVSGIILDSKNTNVGHIEIARFIRREAPGLDIIWGNLVEPDIFRILMDEAGDCVDAVRIGMGTGEVCITTESLSEGRPMGSSLRDIDDIVKDYEKQSGRHIGIIGDGGFKSAGHMMVGLILGADVIMMGSWLAGLKESPGPVIFNPTEDKQVKSVRGMGSRSVMEERAGAGANRYNALHIDPSERVIEGREKMVAYRGDGDIQLRLLLNGVRSSMYSCGWRTIEEVQEFGFLRHKVTAGSKGTL